MIGKTNAISAGGTDTSDATAVVSDILEGKTAYLADGEKHTGTMQTWDGTITGDFEYAYPYGDFDFLISGASIYSGYCPSVIRSYFMYNNFTMSEFNPTLSNNQSTITISYQAFGNCRNLSKVNFLSNSNIKKFLSDYAFCSCSNLAVDIFNVEFTGGYAFYCCRNIGLVSIVGSSYNVYPSAFAGQNINNYASVSSFYFSCNYLNVAVYAFAYNHCSNFNFDNVDTLFLQGFAFMNASIESFSHGKMIYSNMNYNHSWIFSYGTFSNCSTIKSINIGFYDHVYSSNCWVYFGAYACHNCINLETFNIYPANFEKFTYFSLGNSAFANCYKLNSFPTELISSCSSGAFMGAGIYSVYNSIKTIWASSIFANCSRLRFVELNSRNYFYPSNFYSCSQLSFIRFGSGLSIGGMDGLYFGNYTFAYCVNLKSFLTSNINSIVAFYSSVFYNCTSLESVYLLGSTIAQNYYATAFINTPIDNSTYLGHFGSIYVPSALLESYKTTTNWVQYSDRFVGLTDEEIEQIIADYNAVQYTEPEE